MAAPRPLQRELPALSPAATRLPTHAGLPALPPLTAEQRAIAERLTAALDKVVSARRDQIDMVARLATGDGRISPNSWLSYPCERVAARVSDVAYEAQEALDLAILEALDPDGDLGLARTIDLGDQDGMRGCTIAALREIQAPEPGDENDEHRLTAFDYGVGRFPR